MNNHQTSGMRASNNSISTSNPNRRVDLAGNLSDVIYDITQLAELQGQLLMVDMNEAKQKSKLPIILAIAGGLLSLCAMPLLLVAIAQGVMLAGLQPWVAYAIVSVAGLAGGALLLWQSWRSMKDTALVLDRSRAELAQNVQWLKQMLKCRSETARVEANCRS